MITGLSGRACGVTSQTLVDRERQYQKALGKQPVQGDVTLF
jgi:hypothetical protein